MPAQKPFLVGIAGGSGSGKTTFLKLVAAHFTPAELCIISQDDYYRPLAEQFTDAQGVTHYDLPTAIDDDAFERELQLLCNGHTVEREEYTFNNPHRTPRTLTYSPTPIILVEGIFIFHFEAVRRLLDLRLFVHAKDVLKIVRRIRSDRIERNYPLADVLYRYENHVMPSYEQYIEPYISDAHIIVNNDTDTDRSVDVVVSYLKGKLPKV